MIKRSLCAPAVIAAAAWLFSAAPGSAAMLQGIVDGKSVTAPATTIPCDLTACVEAWGNQLLKTGAASAFVITCADASTATIAFVGKHVDKATADAACTAHGGAPRITSWTGQVTGQNCTQTYATAMPYDNSILLNGHPTALFAQTDNIRCTATLSSGINSGSTIAVFNPTGSSGNFPTIWSGGNIASAYVELRTNGSPTNQMQLAAYNFSTEVKVFGTITLGAWQINTSSWSTTTLHDEVNGTNLASDVSGQTVNSGTTFGIGRDEGNGTSQTAFTGSMAAVVLIANSNTNAHTVACSLAGYWNVTVSGC